MNYELFIARRIVAGGKTTFSRPVMRISILSVALGLAVMILSVAIVTGFQQQIRDKITGFGAHIQIARFGSGSSLEFEAVENQEELKNTLKSIGGIRHVQVFGNKAGIVQSEDQIQGVVLKGIGSDFDWTFFKDKLVDGKAFRAGTSDPNDSVLISEGLASRLQLKSGDALRTYFIIDNQVRGRKFIISGIYKTGLEEFDLLYIFGDIGHVQRLNAWGPDQVSGIELLLDHFTDLDRVAQMVYEKIGFELDARTIRDIYPQLFDWLKLQDMNVIIILLLMLMVAGIAMISTLLVLILERTQMIGILKALGARNFSIRKVFIYNSVYIISRGLLFGNLIGIGLALIQQQTGVFALPEESYFMSTVPINLSIIHILLLNAGTLIICTAMLVIPSFIITRISPVKAIRFD